MLFFASKKKKKRKKEKKIVSDCKIEFGIRKKKTTIIQHGTKKKKGK